MKSTSEILGVQPSFQKPWVQINRGLIKLGRHGVCGLRYKTTGSPKQEASDFVKVMQRIPIATNKAFRILWKNQAICSDLVKLFEEADNMSLEDFQNKIARAFSKARLVVYPMANNHCGLVAGVVMGNKLMIPQAEDLAHKRATHHFKNHPAYLDLYYGFLGVELGQHLSNIERLALKELWEESGISVSGRIVIRDDVRMLTFWLDNRAGRKDFHVSRGLIEQRARAFEAAS